MYLQPTMSGLGKSKFKKLFKKLASTLKPPHVRMKEMKKAKARKAQAAAYAAAPAAEATPAPQAEPLYYQEPLPQPAPQPQAPQYYPRPMPAPQPMQYAEPQYAQYPMQQPEMSPTTYPSAMPGRGDIPQWYPPETGIEEADPSTPIVPTYEFEARDDAEYDYMEGLSQGNNWMDIFTGAAGEAVARAKQKRQQRKMDTQSRQYGDNTGYSGGQSYGGFNIMSLMPIAIGVGAYFLLRKKR